MQSSEFSRQVQSAISADIKLSALWQNKPQRNTQQFADAEEARFVALYPILLAAKSDPTLPLSLTLNVGRTSKGVLEKFHPFSRTTGNIRLNSPETVRGYHDIHFDLKGLCTDQAYPNLPEIPNSLDAFNTLIGKYTPMIMPTEGYYLRSISEIMDLTKEQKQAYQNNELDYLDWLLGTKEDLVHRFLLLRAEPNLASKITARQDLGKNEQATLGLTNNRGQIFKVTIPLLVRHPNTPKYLDLIRSSGGFN